MPGIVWVDIGMLHILWRMPILGVLLVGGVLVWLW